MLNINKRGNKRMKVKKAGCVLINLENKKVALVYRKNTDDFSFPKGHLEEGETLLECAIRETEEEVGRNCKLIDEKEIGLLKYVTPKGEDVENYFYLAIDEGEVTREIDEKDKEKLVWKDIEEVEETLSYQDLKVFWRSVKEKVRKIMEN